MPSLRSRDVNQVVLKGQTLFSPLTPSPLSIDPTETWVGSDGSWSPVTIGVGNPPQYVQLLISTTAVQPWVVVPQGCKNPSNSSTPCAVSRGGLFTSNSSTTWQNAGLYTLQFETNLGIRASGIYGFDTVTLGLDGSSGGKIKMQNQTVAGIVNPNFWIATWGIRPDYTNLTSLNNRIPSLVSNLKDAGKIPSLSWGYTAGASYRSGITKSAPVSLTFGGSDTSKYQQHNTTFDMAGDPSRDLVVGIRSITSNITESTLLPTPVLSFLDAGVPHIWLPQDACQAFENAFNLTYNDTLGLYFVNETTHEALLEQNPNITFTIGNDLSNSNSVVNITLPYSSFDLQLTPDYPGITNTTRYFPLKQAANSSQYTLGRTFFQEAYVVADYERRKFSVHQTLFPGTVNQSLLAIPPLPGTGPVIGGTPSLSTGAIAGIVVAVIVFVVAMLGLLFRLRRKRAFPFHYLSPLPSTDLSGRGKSELDGSPGAVEVQGNRPLPDELHGREKESELTSQGNGRYELPNGGLNASELETDTKMICELPGSECATIADNSEYHLQKDFQEVIGAKTWLSDDYVNEDYVVREASPDSTTTLRDSNHGYNLSEDEKSSEVVSLPSPSVYTRSDSIPTIDEDEKSFIKRTPRAYSPVSFEQQQHQHHDHEPVPDLPPLPDRQQTIVSINEAIPPTPTYATIPITSSPDSMSPNDNRSHDHGRVQNHDRDLAQDRNSTASETSIVSALSPRASEVFTGSRGLMTINVMPYPIRKESIVSPL